MNLKDDIWTSSPLSRENSSMLKTHVSFDFIQMSIISIFLCSKALTLLRSLDKDLMLPFYTHISSIIVPKNLSPFPCWHNIILQTCSFHRKQVWFWLRLQMGIAVKILSCERLGANLDKELFICKVNSLRNSNCHERVTRYRYCYPE